MVRVVSQSFNHPRSRHSSGETDLDLAQRADTALSTLRAKRNDLADYESSSDSFWDSELDMDQHEQNLYQKVTTDDELNGNETPEKSDVFTKRKERRRERNKVSAQAYRQRRRQVNVSTQQELTILEEKNKHLKKQVYDLEQKTEQAKQILKGQAVSVPDFLLPSKANVNPFSTTSSPCIPHEPQTSNTSATSDCLSSPCPSVDTNVNSNSQSWGLGSFAQNNSQLSYGNDSSVNANITQVNPVNLNALGGTASNISPSLSPSSGLPSAMPKQNLFNANHYYKIPIHHPKVLRTVHEIPSNYSNEEEDNNLLTINNQPSIRDSPGFKNEEAKASCDELSVSGNVNLNMNQRMNSNLLPKDDKIWNGTFHTSPLKPVDLNDNENSNLSKPHMQNSPPLLLHPNSYVHFIITTGENQMPSQ